MRAVTPRVSACDASSQRRVSCATVPPSASSFVWRRISYSSAPRTAFIEFRFLISTRAPRPVVPAGRMLMLASKRSRPSSILQSLTCV